MPLGVRQGAGAVDRAGEPRNSFLVDGDPTVEIGHTPAGDNRVSGDFTCYVTTAGS